MSPKRIKGLREGETEEEEERTWKGGERRGAWKRAGNKKRRNQEEGEESQRTARSRGAPPSLLRGHLLPGEGVAPLPQAWGLLCFPASASTADTLAPPPMRRAGSLCLWAALDRELPSDQALWSTARARTRGSLPHSQTHVWCGSCR